MKFVKKSTEGYRETVPMIRMRPLAHGERMNMVENRLVAGGVHKLHSHPYEQCGYLISGRTRLTVENEQFEVEPGDSWCIQADVMHQMDVIDDSVIVELFSPIREEYL